jgi:hypothetical protein
MSKHNKYSNFSAAINSSTETSETSETIPMTSEPTPSTIEPTVAPVEEPKQVVTPTSTSGSTNPVVKAHSTTEPPKDADLVHFETLKTSYLNLNHTEPRSALEREKTTTGLLRIVKFVLSKEKRTVYDAFYKFVKDNKNTSLHPFIAFAGGEAKLKRSEIGLLTITIAAFNRVQDNLGVNFEELEKSLPGHPILVTYLSEKSERKQNVK